MFSRTDVSDVVSAGFEAAWQPVAARRCIRSNSLYGTPGEESTYANIATLICAADGEVLDIIPGILKPAVYIDRLRQGLLLADYADRLGRARRAERLRDYHIRQAAAIAEGKILTIADRGAGPELVREDYPFDLKLATALADDFGELENDTHQNQTIRRRAVHLMLTQVGPVRPEALADRLQGEVLSPDITDPILGSAGYRDR